MKKILVMVLLATAVAGCHKFKSVETPIDGTELKTFTAESDNPEIPVIGVKDAADNIIIPARFTEVLLVNNCLLAAADFGTTVFDLNGNQLLETTESLSVENGAFKYTTDSVWNYLHLASRLTFSSDEDGGVLFAAHEVFIKRQGLYGAQSYAGGAEIIPCEYENICVVNQKDSDEYAYLCKVKGKAQWKLLAPDGKVQKTLYSKAVTRLKKDAKKISSGWGDDKLGGVTVNRIKAY